MKTLSYAILVVSLAAVLAPAVMAAPRLVLSEPEFDFGFTPQNSKVSHTFWVYNQGDDSLIIKKVVPG